MFLRTGTSLTPGSRTAMTIDLYGGPPVRVYADVLRRDAKRDGYGLRFVDLDEKALRTIRSFVARFGGAQWNCEC